MKEDKKDQWFSNQGFEVCLEVSSVPPEPKWFLPGAFIWLLGRLEQTVKEKL